jgi:hypothetical protein
MTKIYKFTLFKLFIIKYKKAKLSNLRIDINKKLKWPSKDKINIKHTEISQLT